MPEDALFRVHQLVQRLTPREKGQVKRGLQANGRSSTKGLLFDVLQHHPLTEHQAMRAAALSDIRNISAAVQGLEQSVLQDLANMRIRHNPYSKAVAQLMHAEALKHKNLPEAAAQRYARTRSDCARHGWMGLELLCLLEQDFAEEYPTKDANMLHALDRDLERYSGILKDLEVATTTRFLARWMDLYLERTELPYAESSAAIRSRVLGHPLIQSQPKPRDPGAQYLYWDLLASVHFYLEEWEACQQACEALYQNLAGQQSKSRNQSGFQTAMLLTNAMLLANRRGDSQAFQRQWSRLEHLLDSIGDAKERNAIERLAKPRAQLQHAWYAANQQDAALWQALIEAHFQPMLAGRSGNPVEQFQLLVDLSGMAIRLRRYDEALDFAEQAKALKAFRSDRERALAVGWYGLFAAFGLADASVFESRHRSWYQYLKQGGGVHWPRELALLSALKRAFPLSPEARKEAIVQAASAWQGSKGAPESIRHIDVPKVLDRMAQAPG